MDDNNRVVSNSEKDANVSKNALLSFILGIAALIMVFVAVIAGIWVADLGAVSFLRPFAIPLSVAASILGIMARRNITDKKSTEWRQATAGLVMGASVFIAIVVFMIAVAIFFGLMLSEDAAILHLS